MNDQKPFSHNVNYIDRKYHMNFNNRSHTNNKRLFTRQPF